MIRKSRVLVVALMMLVPAGVYALALGSVKVNSALNEPLKASIPLTGLQSGDTENMQVSLGTREQFVRAGIDRPFLLSLLRFKVVASGGDRGRIEITTKQAVVEPFLNFLIELDWPRGRVVREYTLLLDPPIYGAAISATVQSATAATTPAKPTAASTQGAVEAPPSAIPAPATPVASPVAAGSYGPVVATDTLWSLAERFRPDSGISVQQMMLALLEVNPDAFTIRNVNALKAGAILRIPTREELGPEDKAAALAEVKRQYAQWQELRAQAVASPGAPVEGRAAAPISGESAAPGGEAPGGRVEVLSAGAAKSGVGTAPGAPATVESLRNQLNTAIEDADARQRENEDLSAKLNQAEQIIGDMKRLVQLKDDNIAALQQKLAGEQATGQPAVEPGAAKAPAPSSVETSPPAGESAGAPPPAAATAPVEEPVAAAPAAPEIEQPAAAEAGPAQQPPAVSQAEVPPAPTPAAAPRPRPAPVSQPAPSFIDELLSGLPVEPPLLAAIVGLLLLLGGGAGLVRRRRRAAAGAVSVPVVTTGGSMAKKQAAPDTDAAATVVAARDEGSEAPTEVPSKVAAAPVSVEVAESDEDPLAEVNVYLAYERFDQAEELVRGAIAEYPDRHEYQLKLIEIFHASKDLEKFENAAGELQSAVGDDDPMMAQARNWWQELSPARALFAEAAGGATDADDDIFDITQTVDATEDAGVATMDISATEGGATAVDFDLGFESPDQATSLDSAVDFDIGLGETEPGSDAQAGGAESATGAESSLDFDLTGLDEPATEESGRALDFDLGEAPAADETRSESTEGGGPADGGEVDFDLTGLEESDQSGGTGESGAVDDEPSIVKSVSEEVGGLDFDLEGGAAAPAEESGLDFDLGEPSATGEDQTEVSGTSTDEDAGLELELGGGAEAPGAAVEESGLDFDLGSPGEDQTEVSGTSTDEDAGLELELGGDAEAPGAAVEESGLDFDLGSPGEDQTEVSGTSTDEDASLDLDLGGDAEAPGAAVEESGLDFDLGAPGEDQTEVSGTSTDEDAGLELDLGGDAEAPGAAVEESGLDFDLGAPGEDQTEVSGTSTDEDASLDLDLGGDAEVSGGSGEERTDVPGGSASEDLDLVLDLDGEAAAPAAGIEEGGLDFDLGDTSANQADSSDVTANAEPDVDFDLTGLEDETLGDPGAEDEGGLDFDLAGLATDEGDTVSDAGAGDPLATVQLSADSLPGGKPADADDELETTQFMLKDSTDVNIPAPAAADSDPTLMLDDGLSGQVNEIQTKLDLAQAYIDMDDRDGARAILDEVIAHGDDEQRQQAEQLLAKLG